MQAAQLTGITWDHTRGFLPMVATAQRFSELHPGAEIAWRKRSLKAFGDQSLEELAPQFDLLVIDHPFIGLAAARGLLLPLDQHLSAAFLADQEANSVGGSYASYVWDGHLWALPIDAATPVSAWRPDLLDRPPETWGELLTLARRGLVAVPAVKIDSLMHLYMLCIAHGEEPFQSHEQVVSPEVGEAALELLRELLSLCDSACLQRNPIQTYELLTSTDEVAFCPFGYGYSNYARSGYARHQLQFGGLVRFGERTLRSTLGGTGLAISARCNHPEQALAYAQFVAAPATQRGLYLQAGGQPGHRTVWRDQAADALCGGFFGATLATLDDAFVRPRYAGYDAFQDHAADLVHAFLREGSESKDVIARMNRLYRESLGSR